MLGDWLVVNQVLPVNPAAAVRGLKHVVTKGATPVLSPAEASLATRRISPHTLRHTTAMHLLQSGVDITVIALWLGHENIVTTHQYIEADLVN